MNAKHTPGPWRSVNSTAGGGTMRRDVVSDGAEFSPSFVAGDILPEDAQLIAAAPALLAALEKLAVECQSARKYIVLSETEGMAAYDATAEAILAARTVIAQAKGQQS